MQQCQKCTSQDILYKEGIGKSGKPYKGWFCQGQINGQKCGEVVWVKTTPAQFANAPRPSGGNQAPAQNSGSTAILNEIKADVKKILAIVGNDPVEEVPF